MSERTCLDAALEYISRGWHVLPLHGIRDGACTCGNPKCASPGKHPLTPHGVHDASIDRDEVMAWWGEWPWANVGIATGSRSGIAVIDIDARNGGFESLIDLHPLLPDTYTVETGGKGLHLYYAVSERLPQRKIAPGVDLKADGGYVVAPPSQHREGKYRVVVDTDLAPLPQAIFRAQRNPEGKLIVQPDEKRWVVELFREITPEGERNTKLTSLAGYFRHLVPEGVALEILRLWNEKCCDPPLSLSELERTVSGVYRRYGGPEAVSERWTARTLLETDFPDPEYIVEGLMTIGLTLLAGRPKRGKSWLALQLCRSLVQNLPFLGRQVRPGKVIYLALEDSPRRLQKRLQNQSIAPTDDLIFITEVPGLDRGGLGRIADLLEERPILLVVDTLSRLLAGRDQDSVSEMTNALGDLQRLAISYGAGILVIDHHRKSGPEGQLQNAIDDVLGSTGKTAVADVVMGLYRKQSESVAKLQVTGRDVEEVEIDLVWDGLRFEWRTTEDPEEKAKEHRMRAVEVFLSRVREADTRAVAHFLGMSYNMARSILMEMKNRGMIIEEWIPSTERGRPKAVYSLSNRSQHFVMASQLDASEKNEIKKINPVLLNDPPETPIKKMKEKK